MKNAKFVGNVSTPEGIIDTIKNILGVKIEEPTEKPIARWLIFINYLNDEGVQENVVEEYVKTAAYTFKAEKAGWYILNYFAFHTAGNISNSIGYLHVKKPGDIPIRVLEDL